MERSKTMVKNKVRKKTWGRRKSKCTLLALGKKDAKVKRGAKSAVTCKKIARTGLS